MSIEGVKWASMIGCGMLIPVVILNGLGCGWATTLCATAGWMWVCVELVERRETVKALGMRVWEYSKRAEMKKEEEKRLEEEKKKQEQEKKKKEEENQKKINEKYCIEHEKHCETLLDELKSVTDPKYSLNLFAWGAYYITVEDLARTPKFLPEDKTWTICVRENHIEYKISDPRMKQPIWKIHKACARIVKEANAFKP